MNAIANREKSAQLLWTGFILMFFLIQAVIWMFAISVTANDHSHAVVNDYDEQAFKWDEYRKQQRASKSLGWNAQLQIAPNRDTQGNRVVDLSIVDRNQNPVEKASIEFDAFHVGRAADIQSVPLEETEPGVYRGCLRVRHGGNWQFRGQASLDQDTFLIQIRTYIANSGS